MFKRFFADLLSVNRFLLSKFHTPQPYYRHHFASFIPKHIIQVPTLQFLQEQSLTTKKPILINFYNSYSPVCDEVNDKIDRVAEETGKWKYFRVEVGETEGRRVMMEYGVGEKMVPSLILMKDGKEVGRWMGEEEVREGVEKLVK